VLCSWGRTTLIQRWQRNRYPVHAASPSPPTHPSPTMLPQAQSLHASWICKPPLTSLTQFLTFMPPCNLSSLVCRWWLIDWFHSKEQASDFL
jgi:hypothetical protein